MEPIYFDQSPFCSFHFHKISLIEVYVYSKDPPPLKTSRCYIELFPPLEYDRLTCWDSLNGNTSVGVQ
jgi:hypothetical protein